VSLAQPDHGFELACCRCDAALGRLDVIAESPHGDVVVYESIGGGRCENWVDMGAGVGDVCG